MALSIFPRIPMELREFSQNPSAMTDVRQQLAERARERGLTSRPVNVAGSLAHLGSPSSLASK